MFTKAGQRISVKLMVLVIFAACAMFGTTVSAQDQKDLCGRQPALPVSDGAYNIQNNEFNSYARECIHVDGSTFTVTESKITSGGPGGYPSIYKGCHWGTCTANSGMPLQVSALRRLKSDWETTQPASDAYVAAYDIWFNTTPIATGRPDGAEVMIWLKHTDGIQPAGSKVASAKIGGAAYDVWSHRRNSWNYVAYVRSTSTTSARDLDLKTFIQDAVGRGYVRSDWYLISVEAGFELWQGGTGLATKSFAVRLENNLSSLPLKIWWPKENAVLLGVQPFKARLAKVTLASYQMYWSVDGGDLNLMSDNYTEWDHKEAAVNFSGWTWRDSGDHYGPFRVTFVAKDLSGAIVREQTIRVYVAK
jgi:hypothetical protein